MNRFVSIAALFSFASVFVCCTHTYETPTDPVSGYGSTNSLPLTAEIRITPELRQAKWEKQMMGDTFLIPLGEPLTMNTKAMGGKLFEKATVTEAAADAPPVRNVDAVIIPKLELVEHTSGVTAFSEAILTIMLEWTCLDGKTGKPVFIETVRGEGKGNTGNTFTHKKQVKKRVEAALNQLFRNSYTALNASPEIRRLGSR